MDTDDSFRRLLWHLIGGTQGGMTRARVIDLLRERPYNPNQLADALDLDYTTVRYHLRKMEENGVVEEDGADYGMMYDLTDAMHDNLSVFDDILGRIDKDEIQKS